MALPRPAAQRAMLRDLVPHRYRRRMSDVDFAALSLQLDWTKPDYDCTTVPMPQITWRGMDYVFPRAKGVNVTCMEFALCDDLYRDFIEGNAEAVNVLSACVWRERDYDLVATLRRGDERTPLYSREEAEARAARMAKAPPEMAAQALLWFAGLKAYVHRLYGTWLFEEDDDPDADDESTNSQSNQSPNFGWWGVFQAVAESGVFGTIEQVYQTALHDLCVHLVRKRVEASAMGAPAAAPKQDSDED